MVRQSKRMEVSAMRMCAPETNLRKTKKRGVSVVVLFATYQKNIECYCAFGAVARGPENTSNRQKKRRKNILHVQRVR